jgi:hypothetical protein
MRAKYSSLVSSLSVFLVWLLCVQGTTQMMVAQDPVIADAPPFHVTVLEGEGSINNIHQQVNRPVTVRVEDDNKNPITGASVTFFLPEDGPSGLFLNGSRVLTVFTDEQGQASSRSIRFNNLVGLMQIRVLASVFSQTSNAGVTQTNVSSGAAMKSTFVPGASLGKAPSGKPFPVKKVIILSVLAAGAGAAAYILLNRTTPPSATIGLGTPTIGGPPH